MRKICSRELCKSLDGSRIFRQADATLQKIVMHIEAVARQSRASIQQPARRRRGRDFSRAGNGDCFVERARVAFAVVAAQTGGAARDRAGLAAGLRAERNRPESPHRRRHGGHRARSGEGISGESHFERARQQACVCEQHSDKQIFAQATEERFNGVRRCC